MGEDWRNIKITTRELTPKELRLESLTFFEAARIQAAQEASTKLMYVDHRPLPNYIPTTRTYGAD